MLNVNVTFHSHRKDALERNKVVRLRNSCPVERVNEIYLNYLLQIVVPRGARHAKGLLLSCIEEPDPCIIFEPKILYRTAIDEVPTTDYKIEIGKAEIVKEGRRNSIGVTITGSFLG